MSHIFYQWQSYSNGRAIAVMPFYPDIATMILHQPSRNCKAQANTMRFGGKERLEDMLKLVRRNACPRIAYCYLQPLLDRQALHLLHRHSREAIPPLV